MAVSSITSIWLDYPRPRAGAGLRLFCFPFAGGNTSVFRKWQEFLPNAVEVLPVQLPGRGMRLHEPLFTRLPALVEAAVPALLPYLDRPFAFFGHSMGALISFEISRLLQRDHRMQPEQLFVAGRRAPQLPSAESTSYDLPEPEFISKIRGLNGTPEELLENQEALRLMLPILRADFELVQTYSHRIGPPLDCPIRAFGGLQDRGIPREHIQPWQDHTRTSFSLTMLPGDHFFITKSQIQLLKILTFDLNVLMRRINPKRCS